MIQRENQSGSVTKSAAIGAERKDARQHRVQPAALMSLGDST